MEISEELKAKALACKTAEELLALAADNGIELADEEAQLILQKDAGVLEGELADDELYSVAGGQSGCKRNGHEVVYWNTESEVEYIFHVGQVLQAFVGQTFGNETATVRITDRAPKHRAEGWRDEYKYDRISGYPTLCGGLWQQRDRFEKKPQGSSARWKHAPPKGGVAVFLSDSVELVEQVELGERVSAFRFILF